VSFFLFSVLRVFVFFLGYFFFWFGGRGTLIWNRNFGAPMAARLVATWASASNFTALPSSSLASSPSSSN